MNLSEGVTALTRPHNGPGVLVHKEDVGGFLHLKIANYVNLEHPDYAQLCDKNHEATTIRILVGNTKVGILVLHTSDPHLLSNLWVDAGQEVWASTSSVNRHVVYGFVTKTPKMS